MLAPAGDDHTVSSYASTVRWYAPQSRRRHKAHHTASIHRITKQVEREAVDAGIHKDTEIITQEGARDTK